MNLQQCLVRAVFSLKARALGVFRYFDEMTKRPLCQADEKTRFFATSAIENQRGDPAAISIGTGSHIHGRLLVFRYGGSISIGDECFIGCDSQIWSAKKIEIGSRVFISHGANIHDTDSHPISARLRHAQFVAPGSPEADRANLETKSELVKIEDDAWIGFNASILKGVVIGRGAIVGAHSVVTRSVAPYAIVAGNPAKQIGAAQP